LAVTTREIESNNAVLKESSAGMNAWEKGLSNAQKELSNFGKNFKEQFANNLNNFSFVAIEKGVEAVGKAVQELGKYLIDSVKNSAAFADEMLEMSVKTGVSTKTLQEFNAVQELLDVDLNTFTSSLTRATKSIASGADGYTKLVVATKDASGNFRSTEEVFWDSIDALGGISNAVERDSIAMELFGKSAQDLNPLITKGSEGFRELANQANAAGAVMSDQMLENLSSLQDSFDTWNMSIGGVSNSLGALFAPALKEITSKAAEAAVSFGNLIRKIVEGASGEEMQKAKEEFAASVRALADTIKEQMPLFLEAGGMLIKELCSGILQILAPHSAEILAIVAAVGTAMAAISAAMSLATAGFQTIFSAGIALLGPVISAGFAALTPIISAAMTLLGAAVQAGIAAIQALAALAIAAWPITLAILLAAALAALAVKFWPQISKFLKDTWEKVSSWAKETWPKITKWFSDIWNNISSWFSDLASKVGGWISNVWNAIWGKISGWAGNFLSIGKNLVEGLWNGISDKMQWIKDKIGSFCKSVTNWFKNLFGIESPSKLFKDLIGKNLALGLGDGFTDEMKSVSEEMAGSVPTEFNTPFINSIIPNEIDLPRINADSPVFGISAIQSRNDFRMI
jgi:hypothetical protein